MLCYPPPPQDICLVTSHILPPAGWKPPTRLVWLGPTSLTHPESLACSSGGGGTWDIAPAALPLIPHVTLNVPLLLSRVVSLGVGTQGSSMSSDSESPALPLARPQEPLSQWEGAECLESLVTMRVGLALGRHWALTPV